MVMTLALRKKGFMRTVEVLVGIVLTLIFMVYFLPQVRAPESTDKAVDLSTLQEDESFRFCALSQNYSCMTEMARGKLPLAYSFAINDSDYYFPAVRGKIYAESFLFAGNGTDYAPKKVRVFYWKR